MNDSVRPSVNPAKPKITYSGAPLRTQEDLHVWQQIIDLQALEVAHGHGAGREVGRAN